MIINMFFSSRVLVIIILLYCTSSCFASINTTLLPPDEVDALREIGIALKKKDWNFNEDPCSRLPEAGWFDSRSEPKGYANEVNCTCNTTTVCHVVGISLKAQNLSGTLPPELVRLPYVRLIELTRNYLNGSIPKEWGSMQLVNISLLGNRLTGSIPKELGNISTLAHLVLEHNQLSGEIPPELGNLTHLERLFLNSNNFTGELPQTFAKLTSLREFRIGDNNFTGKIPNYILGWPRLEELRIQGLEGPIPSGIANLTTLVDLRITDLYGPEESTFPPFRNMSRLKNLILRSCNITGGLPNNSFGTTTKDFKILDLSFNKLSGEIPSWFRDLRTTDFIYLTGNLFSGPVPGYMLGTRKRIDLSYNSLDVNDSGCASGSTNLFASSSKNNMSRILSCMRRPTCPKSNWSSLYINCGGKAQEIDGKIYDSDIVLGAASQFVEVVPDRWGFSSTGNFLDGQGSYNFSVTSRLSVNRPELYMDARLSPLSLTYYGVCLRNGHYTVKLHFAEIMFTSNETYSSLGRRIFDVYIQGELVEKDFNIEDKAGGIGKVIVIPYPQTVVDSGTLEIRFFWAGKGTTSIPSRGVYGPLISAISVEGPRDGSSISGGTIAGIAVGVAFSIMLVLGLLWWRGCLRRKYTMKLDLEGLDLNTSFTLRQIKTATNNFAAANKIGEGGFGSVYKGILSNGTLIAVKQLSSKSKQGNREFLNEIGMISALQHQHLVKLYGCCIEGNQLLLVYEYMENNSLARALFASLFESQNVKEYITAPEGPEEFRLELDWPTRYRICIGIARGMAYLHEESRLKIVHRDIKATNVLLDKNLNPKISDFGLAKLDEEENTHISTRVAGTYGYMAPEYALRGYLTDKADVYSYGIVALEIVSGMANTADRMKENHFTLHERALELKDAGNLMDLVDPRLGSEYNEEEMMVLINVALLCTNLEPNDRPMMSTVVSLLEGRTTTEEFVLSQSASTKAKKMKNNPYSQVMSMNESEILDVSIPCDTSTSTADLYPPSVNLNSDYLEKRDIEMSHKLLP